MSLDNVLIPGVAYFRYNQRTWGAPGRPNLDGGSDSWVDPFVLGVTKPNSTDWVGVGVVRPAPTVVVGTGTDITISVSGTYKDKIFNGRVIVNNGANVDFENCEFLGDTVVTSAQAGGILDTSRSTLVTARFCTIHPQTPSPYSACVGNKNYRLERCDLYHGTDIFGAFSLASFSDPKCNIAILGCWAHDMSRFAPDTASNRAETHNDIIQLQGNVGPADDVYIEGSYFSGYHDQTVGQPPTSPSQHIQVSAVMITPNTRDRVSVTIKNSWMDGGVYTLNCALQTNATSPNSVIIMDNVKWEKPHTGGPAAAIGIDPSVQRTITNMTYESDGTTVPVLGA